MRRILTISAVGALALAAAGCGRWSTDSASASRKATNSDQPAAVTCWTYGVVTFDGQSTGRVLRDADGFVSFVDAASRRFTVVEGDCRIVYAP